MGESELKADTDPRLIVDSVPALLLSALPDGSIDYFNRVWLIYVGASLDDLKGWQWESRLHPADVETSVAQWRTSVASGQPFEVESRVRRADGQYRWFLHRMVPLHDERGNILRWYGSSIDVENRKRGQDELQSSEMRWRSVFASTSVGVILARPDGYIESANRAFQKMVGYSETELRAMKPTDFTYETDVAATAQALAALANGSRNMWRYEKRYRHKEGRIVWAECSNAWIPSVGTAPPYFSIIVVDITERKEAENALRHSQAYLADAQALSHTGSFGLNVSTGEMYWSEETFRIFNYERSFKPTLETAFQRVHPEDLPSLKEMLDALFGGRKDLDLEHRVLLPDGTLKHLHVVAHPVVDAAGNVEYIGAVQDITVRKNAFEEIHALKESLYKENIVLREEIDKGSMFEEIVGSSEPLQRVLAHVARVAPTDSTVLITGETGTGKELVARAIHRRSPRAQRAFVAVNCSAVPPSLICSELFGHEKGAFTGAAQRRLGRFELADGGTIFLDEVGDLPAEAQIALLRVLQERKVERVGGSQTVSVDVRVLAATNRNLKAAIESGAFRRDLYYRLNVFPLQVPRLRERAQDIPLLVRYFIERYASNMGKKIQMIDRTSMDLLQSYEWPGNIRELQNVIQRAVILSDGESVSIEKSWLQLEVQPSPDGSSSSALTSAGTEREKIEAALMESRGRVAGPSGAAASPTSAVHGLNRPW